MGCISGSRDGALSTVESISTSTLSAVNPRIEIAVATLMIVSIILTFIRAKFPPTAFKALARQISAIEDALRDGMINNFLDPQFVLDCKLNTSR